MAPSPRICHQSEGLRGRARRGARATVALSVRKVETEIVLARQ